MITQFIGMVYSFFLEKTALFMKFTPKMKRLI